MKKIRQAEENEKKQAERENSNRLDVSFFQEPFKLLLFAPCTTADSKTKYPAYTRQYSSRYISAIFIPPKQLA